MVIRVKKRTNVYVFKASWRDTAKFITVEAINEESAWLKANKRKDVVGCITLALSEVRTPLS